MKSKLFTKDAALITFAGGDKFSDGYAVVQRPQLIVYHGVRFIVAFHSQDSADYIRGKRVLIPVASVTSITEFDSTAEIYGRGNKLRKN
jgi:hypothetical protein